MASGLYHQFKGDLFQYIHNLTGHTLNCALLTSGHSFDAGHATFADVVAHEVSGGGYTASGVALASLAVATGSAASWDADNASWSSSTVTAAHAVIWNVTQELLIASIDFGGDQTTASGLFEIQFNSSGIVTLT